MAGPLVDAELRAEAAEEVAAVRHQHQLRGVRVADHRLELPDQPRLLRLEAQQPRLRQQGRELRRKPRRIR